jgi:hypothetical protein
MRSGICSCILLVIVFSAQAQKVGFFEQVGFGYSTGTPTSNFSPRGNGSGIALEFIGDFLLHNTFGLGLGVSYSFITINSRVEALSPVHADFRVIVHGKFRPYLLISPGYSFYYNSISDGTVQKGSLYMGGGGGVWFPSKKLLHLFLEAKYNYVRLSTVAKGGYSGSPNGYLGTANFLVGYKF